MIKAEVTNAELINTLLNQIEKELGFHIINKEMGNCYFFFESVEPDTICHFEIKEIKGFKFGLWNTCRFDSIEDQINKGKSTWADYLSIPTNSELVFFTQYKRDIDKFKPSRSGFVTGLFRTFDINSETKEENIVWNLYELEDILNYMKKHKIRSSYYVGAETKYIWNEVPNDIKLVWDFIYSWLYYWKSEFKGWCRLKYLLFKTKRLCKKLKTFSYIVEKKNKCWSPQIELLYCRKDNIDIRRYNKEQLWLDKFYNKYFNNINIQRMDYDIYTDDEEITKQILEDDKEYRENFYKMLNEIKSNINETEDEDSKIVMISE